jgi:hypothetical protein
MKTIPDTWRAQINKGVGSARGVDVAVGHVINEDKGAGPVQLHRLLVVHADEQICILLTQPIRLVYFLIALLSLIFACILIYLAQDAPKGMLRIACILISQLPRHEKSHCYNS